MNFRSVLYLFISVLGILVFRLFSIPPFDPPDEQSHFAQINFFVQEGRMPNLFDKANLSIEETFVERVIGTMSEGENKYFFHPEYRYELVDGVIGKYESDIKSIDTPSNRKTYTIWQSSTYPPLYYWIGSLFYRLFSHSDFIVRLFAVRFTSLLSTLAVPFIAYAFGYLIWGKSISTKTLVLITLFFPMTAYLGVGVNSDNLHLALFSLNLLVMAWIIKNGPTNMLITLQGIAIGLDLITKPQAYALFPIFVLVFLLHGKLSEWKIWLQKLPLLLLPIIIIAGWQEAPKFIHGNSNIGATAYLAREINYGGMANFKDYYSYFLRTHRSEIIVWYWGVFKWSGIILPKFFWWIANRLVLLAALGIILRWLKDYRQRNISLISRFNIFAIMSNLIYVFAIALFDWQFYQEYGRSIGLQARYYVPLLITQMYLLLSGLLEFGWNEKVKKVILSTLVIFFLGMHLSSNFVLLSSYYDTNDVVQFFSQLSQYRPLLAKGNWWWIWTTYYVLSVTTLTLWALKNNFQRKRLL